MDTQQKIIEASVLVFTEKGYLGSSTKAIAEQAGVAEMTLFRKFKTKQNLFNSMLKYTLGHELSDYHDIDLNLPLFSFTKQLLHYRLLLISKHIKLVQMIIQESLHGRLPEDLNFIGKMSKKFETIFERYFEFHHQKVKPSLSKNILGIVLHYAILESSLNYHLLTEEKQGEYLKLQLEMLKL